MAVPIVRMEETRRDEGVPRSAPARPLRRTNRVQTTGWAHRWSTAGRLRGVCGGEAALLGFSFFLGEHQVLARSPLVNSSNPLPKASWT